MKSSTGFFTPPSGEDILNANKEEESKKTPDQIAGEKVDEIAKEEAGKADMTDPDYRKKLMIAIHSKIGGQRDKALSDKFIRAVVAGHLTDIFNKMEAARAGKEKDDIEISSEEMKDILGVLGDTQGDSMPASDTSALDASGELGSETKNAGGMSEDELSKLLGIASDVPVPEVSIPATILEKISHAGEVKSGDSKDTGAAGIDPKTINAAISAAKMIGE